MLALSWSFGAPLFSGGRLHFSDFIQQEVQQIFAEPELLSFGSELVRRSVLEETGDFFSSYYDSVKEEWIRWDKDLDKFKIFEDD